MDATSSVALGCFVFKRKRKRSPHLSPSKQSKLGRSKQTKFQENIQRTSEWMSESWYSAYRKIWESMNIQLEELNETMFSKLLSNVINFLKTSPVVSTFKELPTATILTGVNVPDHSFLFNALEKKVREEVSPHVVTLSARLCPKVRTMIGHILLQCQSRSSSKNVNSNTSHACETSEDEDDGVEVTRRRAVQSTFSDLAEWYSNQSTPEEILPVVVILTDFESFSPPVLQDFVTIASEYQQKVPIFLVLGVATSESAVHASLPHRVISHLRMEVFFTQDSNTLLNQLIEKVVLSHQCYFRVGGRVYKLLTDNFLFYDFSVQGFIKKFKFCMLEHFRDNKWSVLCMDSSKLRVTVNKLDDATLEEVRKLKSFRSYVEQQPLKDRPALFINNTKFKNLIVELLENLHEKFGLFLIGLHCLNEMTNFLPGSPLGRTVGNLYYIAVSSKIWESKEYQECKSLWGYLSKTDLERHVKRVLDILKDGVEKFPQLKKWTKVFADVVVKLQKLDVNKSGPSPAKSTSSMSKSLELSGDKGRQQLKKHLLELTKAAPGLNMFETLRAEIISHLEECLVDESKGLLFPPTFLTLHEVLIFDNLQSVKRQLLGSTRAAMNLALSDPQRYLNCQCCQIEGRDQILNTMPDICIAYKLHKESGKHINLYDWLQSFNIVVKSTDNEDESEEVDQETQARFTRAMSEMQFLGFVKTTTRKTDHVIRLTWGNC